MTYEEYSKSEMHIADFAHEKVKKSYMPIV